MKEKLTELLQDDPLYSILQDTPLEETLYTDAQLRYHIKPFEHYIFNDMTDNPTTATVIRLNLLSILKLRMILLLKDEYRVKGLKRLLGIDENSYIAKKQSAPTTALASPDELAKKVEVLSNVVQQMMQTGLFNMQLDDENGEMHLTINQEYLAQNMKLLSAESAEQLGEIQERAEKIEKEQESMKQQLQKIKDHSKEDIAIKIREREIESNVINKLRNKVLRAFIEQKRWRIFAKLFRSSHFELEKEQFIEAFIKQLLQENLLEEFKKYNNKND